MNAILQQSLLVGAGGFLGALARFGVGTLVVRQFPAATFPFATFSVNLSGCLLIGLAAGAIESRPLVAAEWRLFLMIGVLGGFTTFSAFGLETFAMLRNDEYLRAALNAGLQVLLGLLLVWVGYTLTAPR